jgi:phosphoribosylglycinamide formyltransferase-1
VAAYRVAVLASGRGTNLQAILDRFAGGDEVEVVAVASDKSDAMALERARAAGADAGVFPAADFPTRSDRDLAIARWLEACEVDLVVLAGYMQLLAPEFVERFRGRLINVHPALLPSFPGLDAVGQALAHGVGVTGVTVHLVDEGVDSGPIVLQRAVEVPPDRDRGELEERLHEVEHELLPEAVRLFAEGAIRLDPDNPRLVHVDERARG